jgi:hypothetical protein
MDGISKLRCRNRERCDRLSPSRDLSSLDLFLVLVDVLDEGFTRMSASIFERLRMSDTPVDPRVMVAYGVRLHSDFRCYGLRA